MSEQLDVILFGEIFEVLRNDAARRQIHLIYTRLHLPALYAALHSIMNVFICILHTASNSKSAYINCSFLH